MALAPTVLIDEKEYPIPKLKFKQLKACFPLVMAAQEAEDPMEMASSAIAVLSVAMMKTHPEMTPEWLEDNMDVEETKALGRVIADIMIQAGLMNEGDAKAALAGEAPGAKQDAPSTEISTLSSQNSSQPDAAAETGTQ